MTLIEIMVVIAILGLIAGVIAVAVVPRMEDARRDRAQLDFKAFDAALKGYYVRNGRFPSPDEGLQALVMKGLIERVEADPWGGEYVYRVEDGKPIVTTNGRDRVPGGDDDLSSR